MTTLDVLILKSTESDRNKSIVRSAIAKLFIKNMEGVLLLPILGFIIGSSENKTMEIVLAKGSIFGDVSSIKKLKKLSQPE